MQGLCAQCDAAQRTGVTSATIVGSGYLQAAPYPRSGGFSGLLKVQSLLMCRLTSRCIHCQQQETAQVEQRARALDALLRQFLIFVAF